MLPQLGDELVAVSSAEAIRFIEIHAIEGPPQRLPHRRRAVGALVSAQFRHHPVGKPVAMTGHEHITAACRSEEHTSELQSLMRISYAVFCLNKKNNKTIHYSQTTSRQSTNKIQQSDV